MVVWSLSFENNNKYILDVDIVNPYIINVSFIFQHGNISSIFFVIHKLHYFLTLIFLIF